ncbi:MAG: glutamine-hydrolyzing carbamoyl-phosphate synthase small subunit [Bacteroidota bacterium]
MKYKPKENAVLILADGTVFYGKTVGNPEDYKKENAFGEVCFNTGMTGYQEIFTDPSYFGQILVTTNAHIGNYGIAENEVESDSIKISGLVCKNFSYHFSRPAAEDSLEMFLKRNRLFAISDIDTRALVSHIRTHGAMNAVISTTRSTTVEALKKQLVTVPDMNGLELASKVSTKTPYFFGNESATYKIAALDIGVKKTILKQLAQRDAYIKVFPYDTSFDEMSSWEPDGYFLSNGPGDPRPLENAIRTTKEIIKRDLPLFGICLGHQIIALAHGISIYKMHNGHRGINHPVKNLITGRGEITSQNHGFAVSREETEAHPDVEITHVHLNDNTVAGIRIKNKKCFSVQHHPEASPGPHDSSYLFDQFIENIKQTKLQTI